MTANNPKEKAEECPLQDSTDGYRWAIELVKAIKDGGPNGYFGVGEALAWTCNMIEAGRRQGEKRGYRAALEWVLDLIRGYACRGGGMGDNLLESALIERIEKELGEWLKEGPNHD